MRRIRLGFARLLPLAATASLLLLSAVTARGVACHRQHQRALNRQLASLLEEEHPSTARIRRLVRMGADVEVVTGWGCTALMVAAAAGDDALVRDLLRRGADVNARLGNRPGALLRAVGTRHRHIALLLLERGADPNAGDCWGDYPLNYAAAQGDAELVRALLRRGASLEATTDTSRNVYEVAANDNIRALLRPVAWDQLHDGSWKRLRPRWISCSGKFLLENLDLRGVAWAGMAFHPAGVILRHCELRGANLSHTDLRGVRLQECDLRGAGLQESDLTGARFRACDFTGADLTGAVLTGSTFDRFTRWPCPEGTRFDPQAHGARLVRWKQ